MTSTSFDGASRREEKTRSGQRKISFLSGPSGALPASTLRTILSQSLLLRKTINATQEEEGTSQGKFQHVSVRRRFSSWCFKEIPFHLFTDRHRLRFPPSGPGDTLTLFVSGRIREQDRKFLNERRATTAIEQPRNLNSGKTVLFFYGERSCLTERRIELKLRRSFNASVRRRVFFVVR